MPDNKHKIYSDIDTMAEIWKFSKEIGIANLFVKRTLKIDTIELLDALIEKKKAAEFCQIVTHSQTPITEGKVICEVIRDFFVECKNVSSPLAELLGIFRVKTKITIPKTKEYEKTGMKTPSGE